MIKYTVVLPFLQISALFETSLVSYCRKESLSAHLNIEWYSRKKLFFIILGVRNLVILW